MKALAILTKAQAERRTAAVDKHIKQLEGGWWALGKLILSCRDQHVASVLGQTWTQWLTDRFGERKMPGVWRQLQTIEALKRLPEKRVKQLREGNAHELARLPEKERRQKQWLAAAETEKIAEFKAKVETCIAKKTGIPSEKFARFSVKLPQSVFDQVVEAESKIAKLLSLDTVQHPGQRVTVWEAIASLINGTDASALQIEIIGGTECSLLSKKPNLHAGAASKTTPSNDSLSHVSAVSSGK